MKKRTKWLLLLAAIALFACFGRKAQAAGNIIYDTDNLHDGTVGQYYEVYVVYYCYDCELDGCVVTGTLPPGVYAYVDARNWVVLKGTPTTAGEFSFGITGIANDGKNANALMRTVKIAPSSAKYTVTATYCQAKHKDGKIDSTFYAGEQVTLVPIKGSELYVDHYVSTPDLTIPTGYPGERVFGIDNNSFFMPAQNVSVYPVNKIKDLGTANHDAASKGTGVLCNLTLIATVDFAIDHGLIWADLDHEGHDSNAQNHGDFLYYHVDLDRDGTPDLEMTKAYGKRWNSAGYGQAIAVLPGRNVFGTYTLNIPVEKINKDSDTGLYSKIVFSMGTSDHKHDPKLVAAKDATCTAAGNKEHYECSCGSWFWDAAGTNKISNHADAIIKPLGHKMKVVQSKAATCTADGVSWHVECENCGNWYWDVNGNNLISNHSSLITKAYGHKWSEWTVVKPATETEEGLRERYCYNNNSHKEQETIPKLEPAPTTEEATTEAPPETTEAATTEAPTEPETTEAPTEEPTTEAPPETTEAPTEPETTEAPATEAPTEPETTAAPTEAPATAAPTEAPTQPAPTNAPTQPETQAPQKEGGGGNTILWILLGIMAVVAGVLGGILIGQSGKKDDKKNGQKTVQKKKK